MATVSKTNYSTRANNIAGFVEKNWIYIIGAVVVLPWAYKYIRAMFWSAEKQKEEHEKDVWYRGGKEPATLKQRLLDNNVDIDTEDGQRYLSFAKRIFAATGYAYSDTDSAWSWLDPRGWTENDQNIYNALIEMANANQNSIWYAVQTCYFCISRKRSLLDDIIKVLDDDYIAKLHTVDYYSNLF